MCDSWRGVGGGQGTKHRWVSAISGSSLPAGRRAPWSSALGLHTCRPARPTETLGKSATQVLFISILTFQMRKLRRTTITEFTEVRVTAGCGRHCKVSGRESCRGVCLWAVPINSHSFCLVYKICKNLLFKLWRVYSVNAFMSWPLPSWTESKFIDSRGI